MNNRYSRHISLSEIGKRGQSLIDQAKVLVIGAGGLGCPVLQYIVSAGVGHVGIVDFDIVEESNLQRQILFGTSSIGINKAVAAKDRLTDLNPLVTIKVYPEGLTKSNAEFLFEQYDIIVDCTDNFATRYLINDVGVLTNKPVVYGAIYKFEGQVSVFNYKAGPTYRCVFPQAPKQNAYANCSEIGVLGVLPGIIGTLQANEVLKLILGYGEILSGKLYCFDAKTNKGYSLKIQKQPRVLDKERFLTTKYDIHCYPNLEMDVSRITQQNVQFIDVRELHEHPLIQHKDCLHLPLNTLQNNLNQISNDRTVVLFCQSGKRSLEGVKTLRQHGVSNSYSLTGGITNLIKYKEEFIRE